MSRVKQGAVAIGLLAALFVVVVFGYVAPRQLIDTVRIPVEHTPDDFGITTWEDVEFAPPDAPIAIRGWWMPVVRPRGAIVMVHGGGSNRAVSYGNLAQLSKDLVEREYAILAIDMRNHGDSDASSDGIPHFGPMEAFDVIGAVDEIQRRVPSVPIGVYAISAGGSAAIYAASQDPRIQAVVTSETFAELSPILPASAEASTGVPWPLLVPVMWSAELFHGVPISKSRPIDVVGALKPGSLFLIHNVGDPVIPVDHSKRLAALAPEAVLWTPPAPPAGHPIYAASGKWGSHVRTYTVYREEFLQRVTEHFERRFAPEQPLAVPGAVGMEDEPAGQVEALDAAVP